MAYLGTQYKGWQRQINTQQSVQEVLENTFNKMTGTKMSIMGCGRTDVGVHALQYFAHFDFEKEWDYDPLERINRMLPNDIAVYEFIPVHDRAHTRYDALRRTYAYHIHLEKNPYHTSFSTYYETKELDLGLIQTGLESLLTVKDFKHLCLTPDRFDNTLCTLTEAKMESSFDGKKLCFRFASNRFLRSMIRIIVARLLALGEGKISLETFMDEKISNQQLNIRNLAFPQGLHLTKIVYPYLDREPNTSFLIQ